MPLATELVDLLEESIGDSEMNEWLMDLKDRAAWLSGYDGEELTNFGFNIEQLFHFAHFDREVFRLKQHKVPVGRQDGPCTPWSYSESIESWLQVIEYELCEILIRKSASPNLEPILRFARSLDEEYDSIITFNYDTLVERVLSELGIRWNHATGLKHDCGVPICKLHGSLDWLVSDNRNKNKECDFLYRKKNENSGNEPTGNIEDDCTLWRFRRFGQIESFIENRHIQNIQSNGISDYVGIAGLGAYKQLHTIPGLGIIWESGLRLLYEADEVIVIGFSLSYFDAMAQMQFGIVAKTRISEGRQLQVTVIDPSASNTDYQARFRRVFRKVDFLPSEHEKHNWS